MANTSNGERIVFVDWLRVFACCQAKAPAIITRTSKLPGSKWLIGA